MEEISLLVALAAGVIQGVFEWLPVSSEGNITLILTVLTSISPENAVKFSLFLHAGTALSATAYYRKDILYLITSFGSWKTGFGSDTDSKISFLIGSTVLSGVVAGVSYTLLISFASEIAGGIFIAIIGVLLILNGLVQHAAEDIDLQNRTAPDSLDTFLVGVLQGVAVLPGVSRSGTTVSALLLRGLNAESSLRLSFLLSIPASLGAGLLTINNGTTSTITGGLVALFVSALMGYVTIDALMRFVERVEFWRVCVILGALSVLGGFLIWIF